MDIAILVIAFLVILLGAELFTNGIEWFGRKLNLAQGAVGSVLAAVGTALPETMIPIIAIIFGSGSEAAHDVGVGAILGAPFMLSTLAMFVTGVGVIAFRKRRATDTRMEVDTGVLVHDIRYFLIAYGLAIATAFLPPTLDVIRYVVAVALLGIYAWYVKGHFAEEAEEHQDDLPPLRFHRMDRAAHREDPAVPRLRDRQPPGHRRARLHRRRRLAVRGRGRAPRHHARRQRAAARARHRPDRHRAAREVQLPDLGPPGQGHAGDGQHHGRDGVPVGVPDVHRAGLRRVRLAHRAPTR